MKKNKNKIVAFVLSVSFVAMLYGCNTGIDSTKVIKMSKSEQREASPDAEEVFASEMRSAPLGEWKPGKSFLVSDNKATLILETSGKSAADSLEGELLRFEGLETRPSPGGERTLVVRFRSAGSGETYKYNTGKENVEGLSQLTGLDIPMLIDLDLVAQVDSMLRGKTLWTRTRLWYDADGNTLDGRKYVPVRVTGVRPGNKVFPVEIDFTDDRGQLASVLMNVRGLSGLGAESRTFPSLFSLEDPRPGYKTITPERWTLIQNGKVALGMTKEECRLALGNPADVAAGHNWSSVIDIWSYKDGTFLQFEDGLLSNFRH